jgi:hypothetical protein
VNVLWLGLANWMAAYIITQGAVFQPVRDLVHRHTHHRPRAHHLSYLTACFLCAGVWVGFAEAAVFGGPFRGWAAIIINGLVYKAIGHAVYIMQRLAEARTTRDEREVETPRSIDDDGSAGVRQQ